VENWKIHQWKIVVYFAFSNFVLIFFNIKIYSPVYGIGNYLLHLKNVEVCDMTPKNFECTIIVIFVRHSKTDNRKSLI